MNFKSCGVEGGFIRRALMHEHGLLKSFWRAGKLLIEAIL